MLDALLQAVSADDFFHHRDLRPLVVEQVQHDKRPYLALLGGPGEWDVVTHPTLPLYAAYKTNSRDNDGMPVSTHWQLVFTAPGREEWAIFRWEENDKLPLAEPAEATPPPPGYTPKVTTHFDESWRDIAYERLPPGPKEWRVVLHAGSFLSNAVSLKMKNVKPEEQHPTPKHAIKKTAADYPASERNRFSRTQRHPEPPVSGVAFAQIIELGTPDKPALILAGSFGFSDFHEDSENMMLHLLLTADEIPGGLKLDVKVPAVFLEKQGTSVRGFFGLDLRPYFLTQDGKVKAPVVLYITPIRGAYIGAPQKLELTPHK